MKKAVLLLTLVTSLLCGCSSGNTVEQVSDDEVVDDFSGGDNQGGGNQGGDNSGGDNQGGENQGGDNSGGENQGGENQPTTPSNPAPTDSRGRKKIKIQFHVDKSSAEGVAYKKRVDAFNTQYSDKYVVSAAFKARTQGGADYEEQLISQKIAGDLPDIITFDAPNCASYAKSELLYNLNKALSEEEKNDFLSLNQYAGGLFGLPIQESSAGFFYNKKLFAQAGIDVSGYTVENPWTFAQFKDACAKLKAKGVVPVDMRFDATKDETATYFLYPFIYAAGGDFVGANGYNATGHYNSQATKNGFQFLKDLVTLEYTNYAIGATDFFTGKVGMYLSSGWTIPDLDNKFPEQFPNRDSWGLLPYPKEVERASATGSWSYGITLNGIDEKEPAIELLKFMASAESVTTVTDATGMIPCRKSCVTNYGAGSPEEVLLKQLSQTGKERPVTVGYPKFSLTFREIIAKLKNKDVDSIVEAATTDLQSFLDEIRANG